jgi:hypothetical protein
VGIQEVKAKNDPILLFCNSPTDSTFRDMLLQQH